MHGEIRTDSAEGAGTTFTLDLPLHRVETVQRALPEWIARLRGRRVIVASGNAPRRSHWRRLLDWAGIEAQEAAERAALEAALAVGAPDALLIETDDGLPGLERWLTGAEDIPVLLVHGVLARTDGNARRPDCIKGELFEPFGDLALWQALAQLWGMVADMPAEEMTEGEWRFDARILMVEDNDINRLILEQILLQLGCHVGQATNGAEALSRLETERFDIVLMDVQMLVMDGLTATRALRDIERARALPRQTVVALTANALAGDRDMCLQAGMDDYVPKPVTIKSVGDLLQRWIPPARQRKAPPRPRGRHGAIARTPAIDLASLRANLGPEADAILPTIIDSYLKESRKHLPVLQAATPDSDLALITRIVHNLKSASAALGLHDFSGRCKDVEQAGRAGDRARVLALLPDLVAAYAPVERAIDVAWQECRNGTGA
jgi:CheY-like chemotaxis protein